MHMENIMSADQKPSVNEDPNQSTERLGEYVTLQNFNRITQYLHSIRYGHLTQFLEQVAAQTAKLNVFEIGCGYGKTLSLLNQNSYIKLENYFGIDIEDQFISFCQEKQRSPQHQFLLADVRDYAKGLKQPPFTPNVVVALECFEHINEYDIPNILEWIASLRCPLFISVPNEVGPAILLKNLGSYLMGYVRHKEYTWQETLQATLGRLEYVTPHSLGHIGFDYRWLAAVIHQKFTITQVGTSPWNFIPRAFSPSLYFYCMPRNI